jgi:hypothetical protein
MTCEGVKKDRKILKNLKRPKEETSREKWERIEVEKERVAF